MAFPESVPGGQIYAGEQKVCPAAVQNVTSSNSGPTPFTLGISLSVRESCAGVVVPGYLPPANLNKAVPATGPNKQYTIEDVYNTQLEASAAARAAQLVLGAANFLGAQEALTVKAFGLDGTTHKTSSLNDNGPIQGSWNMTIAASAKFPGSFSYSFADTATTDAIPTMSHASKARRANGTPTAAFSASDLVAAIALWVNTVGTLIHDLGTANAAASTALNDGAEPSALDATVLNVVLACLTNAIANINDNKPPAQTPLIPTHDSIVAAWAAVSNGFAGIGTSLGGNQNAPFPLSVGLVDAATNAVTVANVAPSCPAPETSYAQQVGAPAVPETLRRISVRQESAGWVWAL